MIIEIEDNNIEEAKNNVEFVRKESKIWNYTFNILIKDSPVLSGTLGREEMNMIYRLYSAYGSNITQREVSRFFPEYSLIDFKRILRAFNITKASAQFAPHIIEENSVEELQKMSLREKESNFVRSLEVINIKENEKLVKELYKKNIELQKTISNAKDIFNGISLEEIKAYCPKTIENASSKSLILNISDMHIGAKVSEFALYPNKYDNQEVIDRLKYIIDTVVNLNEDFDEIIINLLGDQLDGMNQQTTRGGHILPQNLDDKEQIHSYIEIMKWFIGSIYKLGVANNLKVYSVDGGNHDGITGFAATLALFHYIEAAYPNCQTELFNRNMGHYSVGNHTYILFHGKNFKTMKHGYPKYMDVKTEKLITNYIDYHKLSGPISFLKGDLHMANTDYTKKFRYRNCLSLFGASEWIMDNYDIGTPGVSFDIIDKSNNIIMSSEILLKTYE